MSDIDDLIRKLEERRGNGQNDLHELVYQLAIVVRNQEPDRCPKCHVGSSIDSPCPYAVAISDNQTPCSCCSSCRTECAQDI